MLEISVDGRGRPRCRSCGSAVSHRFCRVFGDNRDEVYGCLSCSSMRDLTQGGAVRD